MASAAFCRTGAKSGLRSGTRRFSTIVPPSALNFSLNDFSASMPGPKSVTRVTTFLMPFFTAHSAIGTEDCARVKLVRTTKGEASVIDDVPAAMTTSGTLACVAIGATASAIGVRPKPARKATLSLTTSSCASRLATSGTPVSSFRMTSIFLPATVVPLRAW